MKKNLQELHFRDLAQADRNLQSLAVDRSSRSAFAEIVEELLIAMGNSPDADVALNNFERFANATFDRLSLYKLLKSFPPLMNNVATAFGSSSYFTDILVRHPEYFTQLMPSNLSGEPKTRSAMISELLQSIKLVKSVERKLEAIRRYKRKESLRIGLRDLLGYAKIDAITLELSNLAEATLQSCYEVGSELLRKKLGTPSGTMVAMAMGKFGGRELNFSSDIDLMFIYSNDGKTDRGTENNKFFSRLCEFIINGMGEITAGGYIFRVDIRLRPESSAGAIIRSIDSYEAYYESWGEIWERQALIKARSVAGDLSLGDRFLKAIQPFIYQRYLDQLSIAEIKHDIRHTKNRIEKRIAETQTTDASFVGSHVKLGAGGIRDIEFAIQSLQLIHGGPIRELRNCNSLETIELLEKHGFFDKNERETLGNSYQFLRRVEHRIQMESDRQRYRLPTKEVDLLRLSRQMGYGDISEFRSDYEKHTKSVRSIFEKILAVELSEKELSIMTLLTSKAIEEVREVLKPYRFRNIRDVQRCFKLMAKGDSRIRFSPAIGRQFSELAPSLLDSLSRSPDPDMALRHFENFISSVGARSSYYKLFNSNKPVIDLLCLLFGTSVFLSQLLSDNPELFDLLTMPSTMARSKSVSEHRSEIAEMETEALEHYKNSETLRIGVREILGETDLWSAATELSELAEAILSKTCDALLTEFRRSNGTPFDRSSGEETRFAIIAMGKLGGRQFSFSSDLDLLLVYSGEGKTDSEIQNSDYFSKFALELIDKFPFYELDLRLRPFGANGALVMSLAGYRNYYENQGETWERQALTRARAIAGCPKLGSDFMAMVHQFSYGRSLTADEISEIIETRKRKENQATRSSRRSSSRARRSKPRSTLPRDVKSGYGGLADIEFAVQILQLKYGGDFPVVRTPNIILAIDRLCEIGAIDADVRVQLLEVYQFLRKVENSLRIVHVRSTHILPLKSEELDSLAKRLNFSDGKIFMNEYRKYTNKTRKLFLDAMEASDSFER